MRFLILFLLLPTAFLFSQDHSFVIRAHVTGLPEGSFLNVMQYSHSTASTIDTVYIKADTFYLAGTLSEALPQRLGLMNFLPNGPIGGIEFWVEEGSGPVIIEGNGAYLATWRATSSGKEQMALKAIKEPLREFQRLKDSISQVRNQYVQAYIQGKDDRDYGALIKAIDIPFDSIDKLCTPLMFAQIQAAPNSLSAVQNLYYLAEYNSDQIGGREVIQNIFAQLEAPYTQSLYAVGLETLLDKPQIPKEGAPMIDIVANDLDGQAHRLSDYQEKGKYLLLDFWSLACGPCIMAAPELRSLQNQYADKLNIVGLSMDTKFAWWQQASERDSITWANLSDLKGTFGGAAAQYGVKGLPTYIMIDPEGKVMLRWTGFREGIFEEKIAPLLLD
ncbi:MAG: TlpA family protein disulfide reductase [Bacteroidia bacterium]